MNVGIIGFGNMAKAMVKGLIDIPSLVLHVSAPSLTAGVTPQGVFTYASNRSLVAHANMIILAVKPAKMAEVLAEIKPHLSSTCLIVSVAAGLDTAWFSHHLNTPVALVRAMPNIAAQYKQSATPLFSNRYVTEQQKNQAECLFKQLGVTTWLADENAMDAFTAFSGSGPAYVFLFIEAMIKGAIQLGLAEDTAKDFALQTVKGALCLTADGNVPLEHLRKSVTSRGGTTEAALQKFQQQGFEHIICAAMQAAYERAQTLNHHHGG